MNVWLIAGALLAVALLPCLAVCLLAADMHGLVAVEVASALMTGVLMLLATGLHRQPFIDLALTFVLLSLIGSVAFARMMEHEL